MKILTYTLCDFKTDALNAVELLLDSLIDDIDSDFLIISNTDKISKSKYPILIDQSYESILSVKFSKYLPRNYDCYIYFDSDILYLNKLSNLISNEKDFTIVKEQRKMTEKWFFYKNHSPDHLRLIQNQKHGINSGFFVCKDIDFIDLCRSLQDTELQQYNSKVFQHTSFAEQSSFNYALMLATNFNLSEKCFDFTNNCILFAHKYPIKDKHYMYHFCGLTGEMESKYKKMQKHYSALSETLKTTS